MSKLRRPENLRLLLVFAIAAGSFGSTCSGVQPHRSSQACDPAVAEIMIWDGRIQKLCGCGGVDGEFAQASTALNCTISIATVKAITVFYRGPFLQHQFVAVGTPAAPNGPVFDPNTSRTIAAHGFSLTVPGTYQFQDQYDHTIFGSIVATP